MVSQGGHTKFVKNDPRLIGNQYGVGNKGGAPRTAVPDKEELEELGRDLIDWIKEPSEEPKVIWAEWYACRHGFILKHWKLFKDKPEFKPYYEQARVLMSKQLINGKLNSGIAQRMLRHYFPEEVKEAEDEKLKYESDLRKQEEAEKPAPVINVINYGDKPKCP